MKSKQVKKLDQDLKCPRCGKYRRISNEYDGNWGRKVMEVGLGWRSF